MRESAGSDGIALGNDRQPSANAEQAADSQVLHCLWLDTFLGRDHQQDRSNATSPGQHVVNKQAMPRHIDKADSEPAAIGSRSLEKGEAEIDCDATPLLFRQPIRIDTSQCTDQRSLAVIDVTCRSNNHGLDRCRHAKR